MLVRLVDRAVVLTVPRLSVVVVMVVEEVVEQQQQKKI